MNHDVAEQLLASLPDGLLPERTEAAVRSHVEECESCRRSLSELEAIDALLRRLPASVVPRRWTPAGEARLTALARWAPAPARRGAGRPWAPLAAFAAGACLALGLASALGPRPRPATAPPEPAPEARNQPEARSEVVLASSEDEPPRRRPHANRPGPPPSTYSPEIYYLPVGLR